MQKTARVDFVGENIQKTESRQIENPFRGIDGVINPSDYLNFDRLLELYQSSEVYYRAVNVKAQYTVGLGWKLVDTGSNGEEPDRERILKFFENCNPELSFSELLNSVMVDLSRCVAGKSESLLDLELKKSRLMKNQELHFPR
ncbi:MAG: hypothetical protein KAH30_06500 [Caldisericia bacterium]|nr:hypothetical protein [Caldisericia bacterium]